MRITKNIGLALLVISSCLNLSCGADEPQSPSTGTEKPTPPEEDKEGPTTPPVAPPSATDGPTIPEVTGATHLVGTISEFDAAMNAAKAGDEIVIKDGTWKNVKLRIDVSGTESKPLVVRAQNPGKAIFSGNSTMYIGGDWVHVSGLSFKDGYVADGNGKKTIVYFYYSSQIANHSTLSNCSFDNYNPTNPSFDDTYIGLKGTYNTVEYCYFGSKTNMGLHITVWRDSDKADYHRIYRNYFYRPSTVNNQQNGQETIRIGTGEHSASSSYTTVEGNFFYQCNGEIEIVSIKSGGNTISGNTFVDCDGTVAIRQGNNNTICGNYFIADGSARTGGVRVTGKGQKIFNNYFYGLMSDNSRAGIALHQGYDDAPSGSYFACNDVTIAANTFVDCKVAYTIGASVSLSSGHQIKAPRNVNITGCLSVTGVDGGATYKIGEGSSAEGVEFTDCKGITNSSVNDSYQRSTMTIAGITLPKLTATTTTANLPSFVTHDISGVQRPSPSPIGAIATATSASSSTIADHETCGPNWAGWTNPRK